MEYSKEAEQIFKKNFPKNISGPYYVFGEITNNFTAEDFDSSKLIVSYCDFDIQEYGISGAENFFTYEVVEIPEEYSDLVYINIYYFDDYIGTLMFGDMGYTNFEHAMFEQFDNSGLFYYTYGLTEHKEEIQ